MKSIKSTLLGLLLSTAAVAASAMPVHYSTSFVMPDMGGPGTAQTWAFDGTNMYDQDGNLIVGSAGDGFVYDYLFNAPPPASTFSFLVDSDGVSFLGAGMLTADLSAYAWPFSVAVTDQEVSGAGILNSGLYDLRLAGIFNVDAGTFSGAAGGDLTNPVPEPMSLSLIGLGLAGLVGARRRKAA